MANPLDVLLNLYGVNVKSVRHLRGGVRLLELFSIEPTSSPNENWNQLRDVLRSYFPQLDTSLNINKCCHGELFELSVASALSVGALIAQDFSKSSTSPEHELSGRLKLLCDYRGPEVDAIKDFCEVVCTGERVAAKVREIVAAWMESAIAAGSTMFVGGLTCGSTPDLLSVSACSSASSSSSCVLALRPPASPLHALRTPENHQRVRDKYSQDIIKLRRELLVMQDRYEHLEADSKLQIDAKENQIRQLQARLKILREMMDQEQSKENRFPGGQEGVLADSDSVTMSRLKVAQKTVEQLKSYEQKFFDEKARAEELETKILHGEKKLKECKAQIQTLELLINERDEELLEATDKIVELQSRLEDERLQRSFSRQRNRSEDTLDNVSGENMGEAVEAVLVEDHKKVIIDLQERLKITEENLKIKEQDLADATLNANMKQEQIESQEALIASLRGQISDHTETISQAATRANELSEKLVVSNDECNGLREKLAEVKLIRDQLKEAMTKNELRAEQLHVEVEQSREELRKMKYIYELLENRYEVESIGAEGLREQLVERAQRVMTLERELTEAKNTQDAAIRSLNGEMEQKRREHCEEKTLLSRNISDLEGQLQELSFRADNLYQQLQASRDEQARMCTKLGVKCENIIRLEQEKTSVEKQLRLETEEKRSFELSLKQAIAKLEKLKTDCEETLAENEQLRASKTSSMEQLIKMESALEEKTAAVQRLEKEKSDLKKKYIAICSDRDNIAETSSLVGSVSYSKTKITELEAALSEKNRELAKEEAKCTELSDAISKEVEDKEFMQETLNEATRTLSAKEKQIAEMTKSIASLTSELESAKANLAIKDGTLKIIEVKLDEVNSAAKNMSAVLTVAQQEKAELEKKLEIANQTIAKLGHERDSIADQIESKSNEAILRLRAEKEGMANEVRDINNRAAILEKQLEAARQENKDVNEAVTTARQELQKTKAKLEANTQACIENSSFKDQVETLRKALAESQEECAVLKESIFSKNVMLDNIGRSVKSLQAECGHHLSRINDLQAKIKSSETSIKEQTEVIHQLKRALKGSEAGRTEAEKALQENIAESQQLTKDIDTNLEQMKEFMEEVQSANKAKDEMEKSNKILKLEQRKLSAEIARLRANASFESSEDAQKLKSFKKSLADLLEQMDVQAPIMGQDELLGVVEKSVESAKRVKELEAEKRTLQRLAENSEAEVKGRITLVISENDQLKRKLRDAMEQLKRTKDELTEVETTIIRAKAGDIVDGGIISMVARDVMNLAVSAQDNKITKDEVTQLRLQLSKSNSEYERLVNELKTVEDARVEVVNLREQRSKLIKEVTNMRQERLENDHEQTINILREGNDFEQERLRNELAEARAQLDNAKKEIKVKDEQISTLLDKYDITKHHSERKISGLHGILHQNNISLSKARRKSPNQLGLPVVMPRTNSDDDLSRKLKEKDEEIRRLKLAKRELEKLVCSNTIMERSRMNESKISCGNSIRTSYAPATDADHRNQMPPPQASLLKESHSAPNSRAWNEFREPPRHSISNLSDTNNDASSVQSYPTYRQLSISTVSRSYSSRSLLDREPEQKPMLKPRMDDEDEYIRRTYARKQYHILQKPQLQLTSERHSDIITSTQESVTISTCSQKASKAASTSKLLIPEISESYIDQSLPIAMLEKPLPTHETVQNSLLTRMSVFDNIGDGLNYKYDLRAAAGCLSEGGSRGAPARVTGLSGLGMGDDEEAQFMNPKNLEELERDGFTADSNSPPSPTDPSRTDELLQRNLQVLPHLKSSYPVETQSGKIPVTPLLKKSFRK